MCSASQSLTDLTVFGLLLLLLLLVVIVLMLAIYFSADNTSLGLQRGGFFVECGALDGETRSNTLFFERERGWSGLLIEADPLNSRQLIKKHRKDYSAPVCLDVRPYPITVCIVL